ncbi:DUF4760 domain-containing protein [Nocardia lijiangensis]|uniref:DUF4760 domain-containing protein n=1 Tax=Nocardia lijiangensis TaxID=299618 RepID=UPI0012DF4799|nr:DUF4760 domain-containing protein [Nocardia lijiangensis]
MLTILISCIALLVSIAAVAASSTLAIRQQRLSRYSNHLPTMASMMAEFRSVRFHDHHKTVVELAPPADPSIGFSDLPPDKREAFVDVVYFYQFIATQIAMGVLQEDLILAQVRSRMIAVWDAAVPYIRAERAKASFGQEHWLSLLEFYVDRARRLPPDSHKLLLSRRSQARNHVLPSPSD